MQDGRGHSTVQESENDPNRLPSLSEDLSTESAASTDQSSLSSSRSLDRSASVVMMRRKQLVKEFHKVHNEHAPSRNPQVQVPFEENGEQTSIGSIKHDSGTCIPCAFWFTGVCKLGVNCPHCHFLHEGQKDQRLRPSKKTRQKKKLRDKDDSDEQGSVCVGTTETLGNALNTSGVEGMAADFAGMSDSPADVRGNIVSL
mmetsp:Transcript_26330/g.69570  ORF Transcript_26330/g.69570 Transcript_26330/m.69570 type:complete len:200 (-) Transcript_26330:110-709(-)